MPPIDPLAIIFDQVSNMTMGLIDDMTSLILGILVLTFIVMGFDVLMTILQHPIENFRRGSAAFNQAMFNFRKSNLPANASSSVSRSDVEISPMRQYDLDLAYRGAESLPPSPHTIYDDSNWERDGVDLSEDRYQDLEDAMEEADRQRYRMSDDDAAEMVANAADDYRRKH